jgi:hypothetical protein
VQNPQHPPKEEEKKKKKKKKKKGERKKNKTFIVDSLIPSFPSALFFSPLAITESQPSPSRPSALTAPHG